MPTRSLGETLYEMNVGSIFKLEGELISSLRAFPPLPKQNKPLASD